MRIAYLHKKFYVAEIVYTGSSICFHGDEIVPKVGDAFANENVTDGFTSSENLINAALPEGLHLSGGHDGSAFVIVPEGVEITFWDDKNIKKLAYAVRRGEATIEDLRAAAA